MNSQIVMAANDQESFVGRLSARTFTRFLLFAGLAMALAHPCSGASIGFEGTGSLANARARHEAVLLPNDKVLVIGGYNGVGELYDPASGTWAPTGGFVEYRQNFTLTLLADGKVLAVGGRGPTFFSLGSAEVYDPATGLWTTTGSLTGARYDHTATLLPNGKVLVAGGFFGLLGLSGGYALATAELYDPASGTWTPTGSLADSRRQHTATSLPNGKVLVAGGGNISNIGGSLLTSAELYDPATGTWTTTGSVTTARTSHTSTLLSNGKVLIVAGSFLAGAELYDPASGTWATTGSLVQARSDHAMVVLPNGKVLVAGGYFGSNTLASAELYDPASGAWMKTGSLGTARVGHTATTLPHGEVLVAGGGNAGTTTYFASSELYGKPIPTLLNISTRVQVKNGDNAMIGGFIITGTQPKTVLVRGIGPSLPVSGVLADPVIEVHGPSGEFLGANDNWNDALTRQQIDDSGLAPANDLESALWGVIDPGAYTVILTGNNGGTGVGLVEVYDLDRTVDTNLANISTRGFVDTGDNVMIGGFIVGGGSPTGTAQVVVRAVGPSLSAAGVAGALADPTLELRDGSGALLASNDNWKARPDGTSQQAEIEATTIPPTNDFESALVRILEPGSYTVIVRGMNNTTGVGLVEAYHLP